jgi:hypothetical protein
MHDTHAWSVRAFELIAAELHARNCALARQSQELYDPTDSLLPFVAPLDDAAFAARQAELRDRARARCTKPASAK